MAAPKAFTLFNKTVAITGATGGIGSAIATRFAREGATLVLIGRDQFKLKEELAKQRAQARQLFEEQEQRSKTSAAPSPPDEPIIQYPEMHQAFLIRSLTDPEAWKDLVGWKNKIEIDILVNCAGAAQGSLLVRTSEPDISHLISTNLTGAIYGSKAVAAQMMRRKVRNDSRETGFSGGCIINVASLLGQLGMTGTSVYAATKAGLVGFTKSLATELAPYIRVNAVLPGFIATKMTRGMERNKDAVPLRRLGTPEEVADAVVFLAKNQYATGCILNLDGGLGSTVNSNPHGSHEPELSEEEEQISLAQSKAEKGFFSSSSSSSSSAAAAAAEQNAAQPETQTQTKTDAAAGESKSRTDNENENDNDNDKFAGMDPFDREFAGGFSGGGGGDKGAPPAPTDYSIKALKAWSQKERDAKKAVSIRRRNDNRKYYSKRASERDRTTTAELIKQLSQANRAK